MNKTRCEFCDASTHETVENNIQRINSCTNCLTDLKLKGNWTGVGHNIMLSMVETYGIDYVSSVYEKLQLNKL